MTPVNIIRTLFSIWTLTMLKYSDTGASADIKIKAFNLFLQNFKNCSVTLFILNPNIEQDPFQQPLVIGNGRKENNFTDPAFKFNIFHTKKSFCTLYLILYPPLSQRTPTVPPLEAKYLKLYC